MKFKKLIPIILPVFSAGALIISSLIISAKSPNIDKAVLSPTTEALVESVIKEEEIEEEWYLIREYEGIIGVFDRSGNLLQTIPVYVITLPKRDREILENGVEIKSRGELLDLIQDYTS